LIEGNARPIEELVDKAEFFNVSEMVLPDIFMDADRTLGETSKALEYVTKHGVDRRFMVIPQGTSLEEWLWCAEQMVKWPVHTIGVPKVLTHLEGAHARLQAVTQLQNIIGDKEIHLLGCWETPLELKVIENYTRQGKIQPVRGVDSAIAYAYARKGIRISEDERPEGKINFLGNDADEDVLEYNIALWKHEAATLPENPDPNVRLFL
jgi:hypothetical protein